LDQLLGTLETVGFLSEEEAKKIRGRQKKDLRSLPEILRQSGVIEIREFQILLRERIEEIVFPLFRSRRGRFSFTQGKTRSSEWNLNDPLSVEPMILEGLRQSDEWPMLKRRVGSFQEIPKRQVAFGEKKRGGGVCKAWALRRWRAKSGDNPTTANDLSDVDVVSTDEPSLSSAEKMIYNKVDGRRSVGEIISTMPLSDHSASKAFLTLLDRGLIRFDREKKQIGKERDADARGEGLIKGALVLVGVILFVFTVSLTTRPQQITWVQGSLERGLAPTFRLFNHYQRERVLRAIEMYRMEHGAVPPGLSNLVQEHLLGEEDLSLWGKNRFSYQADSTTGPRLLIVPSHEPEQGQNPLPKRSSNAVY